MFLDKKTEEHMFMAEVMFLREPKNITEECIPRNINPLGHQS
jgi:hypothetical protein